MLFFSLNATTETRVVPQAPLMSSIINGRRISAMDLASEFWRTVPHFLEGEIEERIAHGSPRLRHHSIVKGTAAFSCVASIMRHGNGSTFPNPTSNRAQTT
jgi:hypothetical protein